MNVYACGIEVLDCTFKNNFVLRTLVVGSETSYENNFILVSNSFFKSEYTWSSIWTERVTDILLYNSYFDHVFRVYNQPNIDIVIAKSVRTKNSVIEGKNGSFSLSGYHADTPITIKAEAIRKADSQCN